MVEDDVLFHVKQKFAEFVGLPSERGVLLCCFT